MPEYHLVSVTGQHHNQHFKVECRVNKFAKTSLGEETSRKKAEQISAEKMLRLLEEKIKETAPSS